MSHWPYRTESDLNLAGYHLQRKGHCSGKVKGGTCEAEIEWWLSPKGHWIPLDAGTLQPHHSTCPDVKAFRK